MEGPAPITVTPVRVADLLAEGERMPVYVHVIDHPDARVLVDTGITELHPAAADLDPRIEPLSEQDFDLAGVDIVVNTHLHFDHCGGNHLFAGKPIYVQRRELEDARSQDVEVFDPHPVVDRVWPGDGVIYSQRLSAQRTKSRLNKAISTPLDKAMTIRSWTTTLALLERLDAAAAAANHPADKGGNA